jgi:hypothetical protein
MQHDDTYYNCSKPGHFARNYKKLRKTFNLGKKFNKRRNVGEREIDNDGDAISTQTDSSYSGTELVYELQDEGSYSDIGSPPHLMTITEEEEDPLEPTMDDSPKLAMELP